MSAACKGPRGLSPHECSAALEGPFERHSFDVASAVWPTAHMKSSGFGAVAATRGTQATGAHRFQVTGLHGLDRHPSETVEERTRKTLAASAFTNRVLGCEDAERGRTAEDLCTKASATAENTESASSERQQAASFVPMQCVSSAAALPPLQNLLSDSYMYNHRPPGAAERVRRRAGGVPCPARARTPRAGDPAAR